MKGEHLTRPRRRITQIYEDGLDACRDVVERQGQLPVGVALVVGYSLEPLGVALGLGLDASERLPRLLRFYRPDDLAIHVEQVINLATRDRELADSNARGRERVHVFQVLDHPSSLA